MSQREPYSLKGTILPKYSASPKKGPRKSNSTKVDILFKYVNNKKVGSCEVGKIKVTEADDKYTDNGMMVKLQKRWDMLSMLLLSMKNPPQLNQITTIGYRIMSKQMYNQCQNCYYNCLY